MVYKVELKNGYNSYALEFTDFNAMASFIKTALNNAAETKTYSDEIAIPEAIISLLPEIEGERGYKENEENW